MNKKTKWLILGGLGVGLIGVVAYVSRQMALLNKACYTVAGAIIHEISFSSVRFTMMLNVKNKSDIDFTVVNQLYHIYVNGMLVAKVDNPEKVVVLANGRSTFKIDVKFNPQDLLRAGLTNIETLLFDKDRMIIELKGYLSLRSGLVRISKYKVDEKLTLKELLAPTPEGEKC